MVVRGCYLHLNLFQLLYYFTHITVAEIRNSCCCCHCCCYFSFVCLIMFTKHTVNSRHELNIPWCRWRRRRRRWSNIGKLFQKKIPSKFCVYFVIMISFFTLSRSLSLFLWKLGRWKTENIIHQIIIIMVNVDVVIVFQMYIVPMTTWRLN